MNLEHTGSFFDHLCFDKDFDVDAWAQKNQVPSRVIEHLKSQGEERLTVYRSLVSGGILSMIRSALPVFCHCIGDDTLADFLRQFLNDTKVESRYYRDIPKEFTRYFKNYGFAEKHVFPFLAELADYECTDYALIHAENSIEAPENNPTVLLENARLFLSPSLNLKTYRWPVHTLNKEIISPNLEPSPSRLILYRAPDYHVHTLSVSKAAYDFLDFFQRNPKEVFHAGLIAALEKNRDIDSDVITQECLTFLKDVLARQIVLALY